MQSLFSRLNMTNFFSKKKKKCNKNRNLEEEAAAAAEPRTGPSWQVESGNSNPQERVWLCPPVIRARNRTIIIVLRTFKHAHTHTIKQRVLQNWRSSQNKPKIFYTSTKSYIHIYISVSANLSFQYRTNTNIYLYQSPSVVPPPPPLFPPISSEKNSTLKKWNW